jgi:hypothetical protein
LGPCSRIGKTDILPFITATAGEFAALPFWLQFLDTRFLLATVLLWTGFAVERISVYLWIRYVYRTRGGQPRAQSLAIVIPGLVLMVLMTLEQSVEMGARKRTNPLQYVTSPSTLVFTFMEVAGAVGWLALVQADRPLLGAACLLVGLSIEHVLQGSDLRPDPEGTSRPAPTPA